MAEVQNPHDLYVRSILSRPESFKNLLRNFAPDIYPYIDTKTLQLQNSSYIDQNLKQYFSDIVYTAKLHQTQAKITILFEHKSTEHTDLYFQLLNYKNNIWNSEVKQKKPRSAIISFVLYHGRKDWKPKTIRQLFAPNLPSPALKYLPDFDIILLDINHLPDDFIKQLNADVYLKVMLLFLKHIRDNPQDFLNTIEEIINYFIKFHFSQTTLEALKISLQYTSFFSKFKHQTVKQIIMKTLADVPVPEDSFYGEILKEGYEKAKKELQQKYEKEKLESAYKMFLYGMSYEKIAEILEIPVEKIKQYISDKSKQN